MSLRDRRRDRPSDASSRRGVPGGVAGDPDAGGTSTDPAFPSRLLPLLALLALAGIVCLGPAVRLLAGRPHPTLAAFVLADLAALLAWVFTTGMSRPHDVPQRAPHWLTAPLVVALATALPLVGGNGWMGTLTLAAATIARRTVERRGLVFVAICGLIAGALDYRNGGDVTAAAYMTMVPIVTGFFAHGSARRVAMIYELAATRAELARMAVAEERLRIARDLHDLLGHSLSLITLKAELAGRLLPIDPERAATEIAEVEEVARRSLGEVRQAVTGYRQPTLAAELAAARRTLAAAGVECRIQAPPSWELPPAVDALLAWTVREGSTNVIRHSGARHCAIHVTIGTTAAVRVDDDGCGSRSGTARAPGAGLAGLAERAGRLGGELEAGSAPGGGFRLRVRVPLETGPARMAP